MRLDKKDLLDNFELYIGGVFISVTVAIVIMNVFTRYCLHFTYFWSEEISVACFVWTIFLGAAGAFKQKRLMGVDIVMQMTKGLWKNIFSLVNAILVTIISLWMCVMSFFYVKASTKVTAALEVSYRLITVSIVISFALMSVYAVVGLVQSIRAFGKRKEGEVA
ncbi:MAG: TRAP transporter small permease [Spirochaetaceae bacterium]|nr:TRAP transporter small permease [Spirochaetaceae bacterium]